MSNPDDNRPTESIPVLSTDPEKKEDDKPKTNGDAKGKGKDEKEEPEMVRRFRSCRCIVSDSSTIP